MADKKPFCSEAERLGCDRNHRACEPFDCWQIVRFAHCMEKQEATLQSHIRLGAKAVKICVRLFPDWQASDRTWMTLL